MFAVSKLLGFLAMPSTLIAAAIVAGLALVHHGARRSLGLALAWSGVAALLIVGLTPLGNILVSPLEQRFAAVPRPTPGDRVDGIVILGGFEDGWVSAGRPGLATNESTERLSEAVRLALAYPNSRVVFTGGVGQLWRQGGEATGPIGQYLRDVGIAPGRIVLEGRSRNTIENAALTRDLVQPKPGERWLLVTSAYHMPRAVGLFRKAGFDVVPFPVDYRTRGPEDAKRFFERIPAGLQRTDLAVNEWLGLLAARALGRTDELFPAP